MAPAELTPAPDESIREIALDPARSFIVQAPAGSGKTQLLINRYLRLLENAKPESIVAITFTIKAAGEMRERVLDALRKSGQHPEIFNNPSRLRIQTNDALCEWLSNRLPVVSGFGGQFAIRADAGELYREAAVATLKALERSEPLGRAIRELLLHLENDAARLVALIGTMLEKRDQWLPLVGASAPREELEASLRAAIQPNLDWLARQMPPARPLEDWQTLATELLTREGNLRVRVAREHPSFKDAPWIETLHQTRRLPQPEYSPEQWTILQAAIDVLRRATAELELVFERHRETDFIEKSLHALQALGPESHPTDLSLALGDRIEHLLIDEMQDTSITHLNLIRRLTAGWTAGDGRTLFLVGDPMQSIYLFREAEVSIFLDLARNGLAGIPLTPLKLESNFRSEQSIVEWVNETFPDILPANEDLTSGAVPYSASIATHATREGGVHFHRFEKGDSAGEARFIADLLPTLQGTTAILGRRKEDLRATIGELQRRGVPFTAVEIDTLDRRPVVLDLLSLTRTLLRPNDLVAALGVLRAPWFGLTLQELEEIPPIFAIPAVDEARSLIGRATIRSIVEDCWRELGGPHYASSRRDQQDAAAFFAKLDELEEGGTLNLSRLDAHLDRLFAAPENAPELQIMTIHKSKGLQFDNVIIPGLGAQSQSATTGLIAWARVRLAREEHILMGAIKPAGEDDALSAYLRNFLSAREENERRRLLYVAATRAKSRLYLLGAATESGTPESTSLLKLVWPQFENLVPLPRMELPISIAAPSIRRVSPSWRVPERRASLAWTPLVSATASESNPTFEWAGDTLRHIGTAVHNWLHRIARDGMDEWTIERIAASKGAIESRLRNLGVPPSELAAASSRVQLALSNVLSDERGRWLLSPHQDGQREYAIAGYLDGKLYNTVIDCTFVDEDGMRWIVDFKTGYQEGGGIEHFLSEEERRYAPQLERYARLLSPHGNVRIGLYFPLMQAWRELGQRFSSPSPVDTSSKTFSTG